MHFWSEQTLTDTPSAKHLSAVRDLRNQIRSGDYQSQTSGKGDGFVQANIVILPQEWAADFLKFCVKNPKSCPLIAVSEPGEYILDNLGKNIDIRTDVPKYYIFRDGRVAEELTSLQSVWRDDLVTFALGCSFSFESALIEAGLVLAHVASKSNVPMYKTSIDSNTAGAFSGKMVVSMRPLTVSETIQAIQITSRYKSVHGAPIHFGDPSAIGITDINAPDFGDKVNVEQDQIPVFWACGVTPQLAIQQAKIPFCITHKPGYMLVTDMLNAQLSL
ncbi:MAG: putative hydro-lyase [Cellvibrionaceae bacterium]